jgi:hypothetical protein
MMALKFVKRIRPRYATQHSIILFPYILILSPDALSPQLLFVAPIHVCPPTLWNAKPIPLMWLNILSALSLELSASHLPRFQTSVSLGPMPYALRPEPYALLPMLSASAS